MFEIFSGDLTEGDEAAAAATPKFETDPVVLSRREKQLEYGRNTLAYDKYLEAFPKDKRPFGLPTTPNMTRKYR